MLEYSNQKGKEFPLCASLMEFTIHTINCSKKGLLKDIYASSESYVQTFNSFYQATIYNFFQRYQKQNGTSLNVN